MKIRLSISKPASLRRFGLMAACLLFMTGCSLQSGPSLDAADRKFAALYSEYLVRSGAAEPSDSARGIPMTSGDLDSLFVKHGIDQKTFDTKLRAYTKDPALWREVLLQVRKNLRSQQ
ncbi:MAG: DUF4296 domain-containing protein [Chlorobiaceae bacterium]|nr:DUF4296 domain-containing protein [Chlorobiaceae bacterium]